jgi:hypothetical protein
MDNIPKVLAISEQIMREKQGSYLEKEWVAKQDLRISPCQRKSFCQKECLPDINIQLF